MDFGDSVGFTRALRARCAVSGPAEEYISQHGDHGHNFIKAVNEAVFADK